MTKKISLIALSCFLSISAFASSYNIKIIKYYGNFQIGGYSPNTITELSQIDSKNFIDKINPSAKSYEDAIIFDENIELDKEEIFDKTKLAKVTLCHGENKEELKNLIEKENFKRGVVAKIKLENLENNKLNLDIKFEDKTSIFVLDKNHKNGISSINSDDFSFEEKKDIHLNQIRVLNTKTEIKRVYDITPILGDIPLIGYLFREEGEARKITNYLVYITKN